MVSVMREGQSSEEDRKINSNNIMCNMCMYVYTHMYRHMHIHIDIHIYTYINIYIYKSDKEILV